MADEGQELCDKQKAWNADYYRFFDALQRSLINQSRLFPGLLDAVQTMILNGQTARALDILEQAKDQLASFFQKEVESAQAHHRYLISAMENFKATAEVLRDYSTANDDDDITQMVEAHLTGIEDFTLAGIVHLDPER